MLLWRFRPVAGDYDRIECHLVRRDMEYRLSVRTDKTVVLQETHRTPTAAAERAENLRRQAVEGSIATLINDNNLGADEPEQAADPI